MTTSEQFAALAVTLNLLTVGSAAFAWWRNSLRKAYAAERDFAHLARGQEQIKEAIKLLQEASDANEEEIAELRGALQTLVGKFVDR